MTKLDDLYKPHVGAIAFDISENQPSNGVHVRWFAIDIVAGGSVFESDGTQHKYGDVVTCHQMFVLAKSMALTDPYEDVMMARILLESYAYFVAQKDNKEIDDITAWMTDIQKPVAKQAWGMLNIEAKKQITEHRKATAVK